MTSTFHGLETARRGMMTQQGGLYTLGHNLANANTPGFSRQRVNFQPSTPYPAAGRNRPDIPGQVGTGVEAGSVQRVRDSFLDKQYRSQFNDNGYWLAKSDALSKMEKIMSEPLDDKSEAGLSRTLDRFWQSIQDLQTNPSNDGALSVIRERAKLVGDTFNYLSNSLTTVKNDLKEQIDVSKNEINSLLAQINQINKQIGDVEPHGYLPNDLYDQRDQYVDKLSQLIDIKVTRVPSGGNAQEIAEGKYTIELVGFKDSKTNNPIKLVDGADSTKTATFNINYENDSAVNSIEIVNADGTKAYEMVKLQDVVGDQNLFKGKLKGLIESYGYVKDSEATNKEITGVYPNMLHQLDKMAYSFVKEFNKVHESGWTSESIDKFNQGKIYFNDKGQLVDSSGAEYKTAGKFFEDITKGGVEGAAKRVSLDQSIIDNAGNIATAGSKYYPSRKVEADGSAINVSGSFLGYRDGKKEYDSIEISKIDVDASGNVTVTAKLKGLDHNTTPPTEVSMDYNGSSKDFFGLQIDTSTLADKAGFSKDFKDSPLVISKTVIASGDNSNAVALGNIKNKEISIEEESKKQTVQGFYRGFIGQMAVEAQKANQFKDSSDLLTLTIDNQRQAVSAVSTDEELTNMIKFQQAYNASARMITTLDQMLDKIINGMGLVGR